MATLKRSNSELGSYQQKVYKIDEHMGIGIAGLTPVTKHISCFLKHEPEAVCRIQDGRVLSRFMRSECLNHKFVYGRNLPIARLVNQVADSKQLCAVCCGSRILTPHFAEAQIGTQRSGKRPYGVGLLVIGMDVSVPAHCCFDTLALVTHCCSTDVLPTAGGPAKVI